MPYPRNLTHEEQVARLTDTLRYLDDTITLQEAKARIREAADRANLQLYAKFQLSIRELIPEEIQHHLSKTQHPLNVGVYTITVTAPAPDNVYQQHSFAVAKNIYRTFPPPYNNYSGQAAQSVHIYAALCPPPGWYNHPDMDTWTPIKHSHTGALLPPEPDRKVLLKVLHEAVISFHTGEAK